MTYTILPIDYSKTPTPLPPAPRHVHGGWSHMAGLWFVRLFIMPHTLVGIGALGFWIFLWLWIFLGWNVPGKINGSDITHSSKGGTSYNLKYQYQIGARTLQGSASVHQDVFARFVGPEGVRPQQRSVTVRYFELGPFHYADLQETGSRWLMLGFITIWVVFWNGILSIFVYQFWILPVRVRGLYRRGAAVHGLLINKRVSRGKSTSYYISYEFTDPVTNRIVKSEIQIWSRTLWEKAAIGHAVTVLFAPSNPQFSTVYEFGGYTVNFAGAGMALG